MTPQSSNALSLSRKVLRALIAVNFAIGAAILVMLVVSFVAKAWFFRAMGAPLTAGAAERVIGMRGIMGIGLMGIPLTHVIFSRLLAIVETVRDGDPFVAENATRLHHIAWSVLGLEILNIAVTSVAAWASTDAVPIDIKWRLNVTRWVTVLLLFVLARVFEHGTRMRDDLAGTV